MGVKRDSQRKRVGEKLLKWLEKEAKKYKLHSIEIETCLMRMIMSHTKKLELFITKMVSKGYFTKKRE